MKCFSVTNDFLSLKFTVLHTASYNRITEGKGFGIYVSKQAIDKVYTIRNKTPIGLKGEYHPMCKNAVK